MPLSKKQAPKQLSAWGDRLKAMQDGVKAAMENYNPSAYVQVPDGVYIAKETCEFNETKAGKLRINRRFTIIEGEQTNLSVFDGLVIEDNETGLHIARRWVEQHGYEWPEEDMSSLEGIINEINTTAPTVKIRSKTTESSDGTRTFTNVTVSQILEGYESQQDATDTAIADDANNADPNAKSADEQQLAEDDEERQSLLVLAASHGIDDVNDSMSKDDIAAALAGWQFNDDEITPDENALLESIGLAGNIVRKPKPLVKKQTPAQLPKAPNRPPLKRK
jgi:hypothetical protein